VTIESGYLELIQRCNDKIEVCYPILAILAEYFLKSSLAAQVSFKHCHRDSNRVAHELATFAYCSNVTRVWDGDPPGLILPCVIHDITLLCNK
jgi:hypothetical protein